MTIAQMIRKKIYEEIVYRLRRHPFLFVKDIFLFLLLAIAPLIFYYLFSENFIGFLEKSTVRILLMLIGSIYYLAIWVFFYGQFVDYYLDNWIITNDRLISIEQKGLFMRSIAELDLYRIQDVKSEVKGIFGTIFNYGNLHVQTAGEEKELFILKNIPDPHNIREHLLDLAEEDRKYHTKSPI
jgi:uncharacterized membrane protein YdbT with pleckstrin-like domain